MFYFHDTFMILRLIINIINTCVNILKINIHGNKCFRNYKISLRLTLTHFINTDNFYFCPTRFGAF
jgi:hypothetical protein